MCLLHSFYFKTKFKLVGEELWHLISQIEEANWEKWETESWILKMVTFSMKTTTSPVALRIKVMQFQGREMRRLPCSQGCMIRLVDDFKDVIEFIVYI